MAISWKVTQVCWSKSPSRKPLISDEKMRLGLLIRNGSIQRPEAISQSREKAADDGDADGVTVTPRIRQR